MYLEIEANLEKCGSSPKPGCRLVAISTITAGTLAILIVLEKAESYWCLSYVVLVVLRC